MLRPEANAEACELLGNRGIGYQALPMRTESRGRALTDQEYIRLFSEPPKISGWDDAWLFAVISVNIGAGPKEVSMLRL